MSDVEDQLTMDKLSDSVINLTELVLSECEKRERLAMAFLISFAGITLPTMAMTIYLMYSV